MVVDLARLREQTIGSNVDEEAVTVNTRALIDKVLARYSGEWTTLRELIQNAADAAASKVIIKIETLPSKSVPLPPQADKAALLSHTLSHHTIYRMTVSNDGQHFADTDWSRLKRIAEGNPDETKIGAFGVGFYSVFADCEEPFVISGRKTMAFIWKGNSLFTKASTLPHDQSTQETCFMLNYRNTTSPIPDLMSICQFLCTSLTFVGLQHIELWIDRWNILTLHKKSAPGAEVALPSDINPKTKEGLMKITGVVHQSTQIDAKWMNVIARAKAKTSATQAKQEEDTPVLAVKSFFSKLASHTIQNTAAKRAQRERDAEAERLIVQNLSEISQGSVFLRISTVNIQTTVSPTFAAELERATKKPPPKNTRIAILTTSFEEASATLSNFSGITGQKSEVLFSSILPTKTGRIFIGFPTAQTTGMFCHISAPSVIPTVERESIDLNARYVKTWNTEMLRVAGIACRVAYGGNMQDLKRQLNYKLKSGNRTTPTSEDIESLIPHATHISQQFCANESTPSIYVGQLIEEGFWGCSKRSTLEVLSTKGVLPSHQVRVVSEPLSFLEAIPIIPSALAKATEDFINKLYEKALISDLTVVDVRKQLEAQSLTENQMIEFLKYLAAQASLATMDRDTVKSLLNAAVGMIENDGDSRKGNGQMVVLSEVRTFLSASKIPPTMPVPLSTIPFKLTRSLAIKDLSLFEWEELQMLPWLEFLSKDAHQSGLKPEQDITKSASFAASVLHTLSKQWDQISQAQRNSIAQLLSNKRVMPTKLGLKLPTEAYFATVKLFDDLPTVSLEVHVKEKVLVALGVRKTIELNVVFERLMSPSEKTASGQPKWSFADLIRYFVSVRNDIPTGDINRLRTAAICPVTIPDTNKARPGVLATISQLYEPLDSLKGLQLPTLCWPGVYNTNGTEAQFMKYLGLKSFPVAQDLVKIMAVAAKDDNLMLYDTALAYYLSNYDKHRYSPPAGSDLTSVPFLPVEGAPFPTVVPPRACYANAGAAVLGYRILKANLKQHATRLGVLQDPHIKECITSLIGNPPATHRDAVAMFSYLGSRIAEIPDNLAQTAGAANIVPISYRGNKKLKMASPKMCFLGDSSTYGEILDFVDFGQTANMFLLKVGSKQEPTTTELANMIKDSPAKVLNVLGQDRYLDLLRRLAEHQKVLKQDTTLWKHLKAAPFLLAYRDTRLTESGKLKESAEAYEDDNFVQMVSLRSPSQIVVNDNYREFVLFREHLHSAPPDDTLERFYLSLGVPSFQSILVFDERVGALRRDQSPAVPLQKLIIERTRLFLHEYSQDIVHDAKWLEKNLSVMVADSLSLTTSLKTYRVPPYKEKKTAIISHSRKETVLFITPRPDLYEISRCIIPLLLSKPKQHDVLALEMVLDSDLRRLRSKGYNVDRILRQQERQTRIAEEERVQQQVEEEKQLALREKDRHSKVSGMPAPPPPPYSAEPEADHHVKMPGAFEPDSPPRPPPKNPRGLLDQVTNWSRQLTGHHEGTPPQPSELAHNQNSVKEPTAPQDVVNSHRRTEANLQNAIRACREHNSSSVFSPPTTAEVTAAQGSYCDATPAQNLTHVGIAASGVKYFIAKELVPQAASIQRENAAGIDAFSALLLDLAAIFALPGQNIHMFMDPATSTIAFNLNGALFFNFNYFQKLHLAGFKTSRDSTIDTIAYWWVTLCHELAHNLAKTHSAEHSFYTESFASQYFAKAMAKALQY
jgi:uncharacterized protein DUF3684